MGSPFCRCQAHSFCCLFLPDKTEENVSGRSQSGTVCLRLWAGEVREAWAHRESSRDLSTPAPPGLPCLQVWGELGFAFSPPCLCSTYCDFYFHLIQ